MRFSCFHPKLGVISLRGAGKHARTAQGRAPLVPRHCPGAGSNPGAAAVGSRSQFDVGLHLPLLPAATVSGAGVTPPPRPGAGGRRPAGEPHDKAQPITPMTLLHSFIGFAGTRSMSRPISAMRETRQQQLSAAGERQPGGRDGWGCTYRNSAIANACLNLSALVCVNAQFSGARLYRLIALA